MKRAPRKWGALFTILLYHFHMKNSFENNYVGSDGGFREHSDSTRPNLEALNKKRDEYLESAVSEVISKLDKNEIVKLQRGAEEVDSKVLKSIAEDVLSFLFKFHRVDFNDIRSAGKIDVREGVATSDMNEVEDTYPEDLIIKKVIAYFSKK